MIRYGISYCPCCMERLLLQKVGNHFYCLCRGWAQLDKSAWLKEVTTSENFDLRSSTFIGQVASTKDKNEKAI